MIDASHRDLTGDYPARVYDDLAVRCVELLLALPYIPSVAVCGSVAKADVVSCWSDLDLVVFVSGQKDHFVCLKTIREAINRAREGTKIAIGADIVYTQEFQKTYKLCGRPIYVSYDIAAYARIYGSHNFFQLLLPVEQFREQIVVERSIVTGAEIHNWRRVMVSDTPQSLGVRLWAARCIKTLLKLLQYETGPLNLAPFTYYVSLEKLRKFEPNHPALAAFSEAVEARSNWPQIIQKNTELKQVLATVTSALAEYPNG